MGQAASSIDWASPGQLDGPPLAPFGAVLSSWWRRVGALLLDALILAVPYIILRVVFVHAFGHDRIEYLDGGPVTVRVVTGAALALEYVVMFLLGALYFVPLNGLGTGQTVGNRAAKIAVRDLQTGAPLGLGRSFVRYFVRSVLYVLLVVPGLVNDLFPLWDRKNQTLADKAAKSVMIRLR